MKGIYWRPQHVSRPALLLIALIAAGGYICVEHFPSRNHWYYYHEQLEAARLALTAMEALKTERLKMNPKIDEEVDPAQTGLIGPMLSPVTSEVGDLEAKQAALNPNFAALVVQLLKRAGVRKGDTVGVGYTGSFPGMNIAVCAALQVLKVKPVIISSASSSEWGATDPHFLWIDMERLLHQKGLISFHSVAASLGGSDDRGGGLSSQGRQMLAAGIQRNGLTMLEAKDFQESVALHMRIYSEHNPPLMAYINVGGGMTSTGGRHSHHLFKPGLNRSLPPKKEHSDSLMLRFLTQKVPVIHLIDIRPLGRHHGVDVKEGFTTLPLPGQGEVYFREWYNPFLAAGVLLLIFASLYAFILSDWGFRIFQSSGHKEDEPPPERMV